MSCNHLSPAIAVWLSSNLSFPPTPSSLMPSSPLPTEMLVGLRTSGSGHKILYYAMLPKKPVNEKKEALTVGTLPPSKDREVFQKNRDKLLQGEEETGFFHCTWCSHQMMTKGRGAPNAKQSTS